QLLWFPKLIRYIRVRAKYNSVGGGKGPYQTKGPRSRVLVLIGFLYVFVLIGVLTALVMHGNPWLLALVPAGMLTAILTFYSLVPERLFLRSLVKPDVSMRHMTFGRLTFTSILFTTLAWLTYLTDHYWALYYFVLWIVPLFTTFSFFMILRQ